MPEPQTFKCHICGCVRHTWDNLQVHMRQAHGPGEAEPTPGKPTWECPYCGMTYEVESAFANHVAKYCIDADKAWERSFVSDVAVERVFRGFAFLLWCEVNGRP